MQYQHVNNSAINKCFKPLSRFSRL
uniref:Uncharacterized protein n=1 Tax=Arundo donax TaxID=35708 RepID=A0A0A9BT88_ARUDO